MFNRKLQSPPEGLFLGICVCRKKVTHLRTLVITFDGLFVEAVADPAILGQGRDAHLAQSSVQRPNPELFHVRNSHEAITSMGWSWDFLLLYFLS